MSWHIQIENIAGILDGETEIEPGLNAVRGSNWQGKSSFIEAIKTALGASKALTEGKESGYVTLSTEDRNVTVELVRKNGDVQRNGTPILTDEYDVVRTELFACLDERNEIRHHVREGKNLEEVLLRPLDFQNIDEQILELKQKREQIESERSQAREAKKRLPSTQERVTHLQNEIEELEERREALSEEEPDDPEDISENARTELSNAQTERSHAESQIERLERSISRAEQRLEELRDELEDLEVADDDNIEEQLAEEREKLKRAKQESEVLQSVYSANEMVLNQDRIELLTEVDRELSGDKIACWTCNEKVEREQFEQRLELLGEKIAERRAKTETHRDAVEELEARREEIEQTRRRKLDLESEISDLEESLSDRKQSLEDARERREDAKERIESLSESVNETVDEITDIESEIKYREAELKDAKNELEELESRAQQVETLEEQYDSLQEEIEELRNRKEQIKYRAREAFGEAMQELIERFDTGFETARLTSDFDLVVARGGREASLDALSEGELELLGFVAALSGYISFDVDEVVPILLIDGVGSLADDNLHTLIDYLEDRTEYLVFTAYPEHTSFEGQEIDPTDWHVATHKELPAN